METKTVVDEQAAEYAALTESIIDLFRDAREQLAKHELLRLELGKRYGYKPDMFADMRDALEHLFVNVAYLSANRAFFGLPPKPSRQDDIVRSMEQALERARAILKSAKAQQSRSFTAKSGAPSVTAEDILAAEERVEQATENLERARGNMQAYQAEQAAKRGAKREAEKREAEVIVSGWQAGWRAYAQKQRDSSSS